ncbi:hypothetical protein O6H91_01G073800 [Diphasiastrum complanatum]|uniref:Uncharacterized protein n=1 Tax=Diphasiastrum complanatum TaxID=34168 RepID=A0ACC2ES78_DIPCM|nr:hypothetical protein O6H91_01G073800 [Diphasiastrum complanatum]
MAERVLVLKHLIMPNVLYFLSCWMPSECDLRRFEAVCRSLLWTSKFDGKGYVGVAWDTCTLPKKLSELGLPNLKSMASRNIARWLVRVVDRQKDLWAYLLQDAVNQWAPIRALGWKNWKLKDLLLTEWKFKGKGSELFISLWMGWEKGGHAIKAIEKELCEKGGVSEMSCWAWREPPDRGEPCQGCKENPQERHHKVGRSMG